MVRFSSLYALFYTLCSATEQSDTFGGTWEYISIKVRNKQWLRDYLNYMADLNPLDVAKS